MADFGTDFRPVAELLHTLSSEGVRADNRERLHRQLAHLLAAIKQFSDLPVQMENWTQIDQQSQRAVDAVWEQLRFAREARQLLEESIVAAETFVSMRLAQDDSRGQHAGGQQMQTDDVLRARPITGDIDHAALSREFIARFPKIRAALAK